MNLFQLLTYISMICPLLVFLDYHKRSTIHLAIIYVIVFFFLWKFILFQVIHHYGLYLAGAAPFLLIAYLLIAKKRS